MKKKKRSKIIKNSSILKFTFYFSLLFSIIFEIVSITYLYKKIMDVVDFLVFTILLALHCMITFGVYIVFLEIENVEEKTNLKIKQILKKIKKD